MDLLNGGDLGGDTKHEEGSVRGELMEGLRSDINDFGAELIDNLDREELEFAAPVARKVSVAAVMRYTKNAETSTIR